MEGPELCLEEHDFSTEAEEHRLHRECGITCHLSSHTKFHGKIKAFPEDFKVIEIDNDGNLVCGPEEIPDGWNPVKFRRQKMSGSGGNNGDTITEVAQLSDQFSTDKDQTDTTSGKDDYQVDKKAKMGENSATVDGRGNVVSEVGRKQTLLNKHGLDQTTCSLGGVETCSTPLGAGVGKWQQCSNEGDNVTKTGNKETVTLDMQMILGEDRLLQLKNFSNQVLEVAKETQLDKDQSDIRDLQLSLGTFDSKTERSVLHKEIKSRYPHLKTTSSVNQLCVVPDKNYWVFCSLMDRSVVDGFMRFVNNRDPSESFKFPKCDSKEQRTEIHRAVARHYGSFLETKTFAAEGEGSFIVVRFREKAKKRKNRDGSMAVTFYTGFTLCKRNLETLDVIQRLARCVGAHPSDFSYAGVKDKRAVTWQAMAAKGVTADSLRTAAAHPSLKDVRMDNFLPRQQPLRLGNLAGNVFKVLLRDVRLCEGESRDREELEAVVGAAMNSVKERGFINYFGLQRFGSADSKSFAPHVGRALLKGDMSAAVGCLLHPDPDDNPVNRAKAYYVQTGDIPGTLARMPAYKTRECLLLKALHRHGTDHEGCTKAFLNVPHAMRSLFVHSYCSLVWNRMVSHRIQTYGWRVVEGDLVLDSHAGNRKVRPLTQTDVEQNTYSIHDIVLPLPGNSIQYPSNQVGEEYMRALREDGIEKGSFRMRSLKLNIPGDYRHVTARPKALEWELLGDGGLQKDTRSLNMTAESLGTKSPSSCSTNSRVKLDTPQGDSSLTNNELVSDAGLQKDTTTVNMTAVSLGTESPSLTSTKASVRHDTPQRGGSMTNDGQSQEMGVSERTDGVGSHGDSCHVRACFVLDPSCYATMFLREVMNT